MDCKLYIDEFGNLCNADSCFIYYIIYVSVIYISI